MNLATSSLSPSSAAAIILREAIEILLPFAAAQIDAEPRGIELGVQHARVVHRLLGGAGGELACAGRGTSNARRLRRPR